MKKKNPLQYKIGVLGGGQLGKMLYEAALPLGLNVHFLDKSHDFPVGKISPNFHTGDFRVYEDVVAFAQQMDIVTIEIESVNVEALRQLEKEGITVYPQPDVLEVINDKGLQKTFYREQNLPTSPFVLVSNKEELLRQIDSGAISFPFVQKLRKGGYDGRGVQVIQTKEGLKDAFDAPSVIEKMVDIDKEIGVLIARGPRRNIVMYPPVEMVFYEGANLVDYVLSPAQISFEIMHQLMVTGTRIADALGIVGLLAIEFFIDRSGAFFINEVAPRTHNSAHHTIEASDCSQFEQQLRCITGLPLGSSKPRIEYAAMINIVGPEGVQGPPVYEGIQKILKSPGVYPHIYGKAETKPFRKMGHITVIREDLGALKRSINSIKKSFHITTEKQKS